MIPIHYNWEKREDDGKEIFVGTMQVAVGIEINKQEFASPLLRAKIIDEAKEILKGRIHQEVYGAMDRELVDALSWALSAVVDCAESHESSMDHDAKYQSALKVLRKHTGKHE